MEPDAYDKFITELKQAMGEFLGMPPHVTTSILADLMVSLDVAVRIIVHCNEQPENQAAVDALDCLQKVCEKLPSARRLRSYVGRVAGMTQADRRKERGVLLRELEDLLRKGKLRLKRI